VRWRTPNENEVRVRRFFAWIPVLCSTTEEWRWLERVTAQCMYVKGFGGGSWMVVKFLD
jgi:hypothetical protein